MPTIKPTTTKRKVKVADPLEFAKKAVDAASEKQATDITLLDLRGHAAFADFFIICTADNPRQLSAIADEVDDELAKSGRKSHHREGRSESGWVLLDYGDIVVHVFSEKQRNFYDLEAAWNEAPVLVRMQ